MDVIKFYGQFFLLCVVCRLDNEFRRRSDDDNVCDDLILQLESEKSLSSAVHNKANKTFRSIYTLKLTSRRSGVALFSLFKIAHNYKYNVHVLAEGCDAKLALKWVQFA